MISSNTHPSGLKTLMYIELKFEFKSTQKTRNFPEQCIVLFLNEIGVLMQVKVSNYWEAIGVIAAHKAGVNPHSLRKDKIKNLQRAPLVPDNGYAVSSTKPIA